MHACAILLFDIKLFLALKIYNNSEKLTVKIMVRDTDDLAEKLCNVCC